MHCIIRPASLFALTFVAILVSFVMIERDASGQTPTPVMTVAPNSTNLTVTNTLNGIPVVVPQTPVSAAYANGQRCSRDVSQTVEPTISSLVYWPWGGGNEPICSAIGASVQICHGLTQCSAPFTFDGSDTTVDIPWPPPPPESSIRILTFNFLAGISPTDVSFTEWEISSGPAVCSYGQDQVPTVTASVSMLWLGACSVQGTAINYYFETESHGRLSGSFEWTGEDQQVTVVAGSAPTSTASATPTPYPQSTVSVRFHEGPGREHIPVEVILDAPITKLTADGVDCTPDHPAGEVRISAYRLQWPRREPGLPEACTKGPPTTLQFEFTSLMYSNTIEGIWTGSDLTLLYGVLGCLSSGCAPDPQSPTPTATAAPKPASLPAAGARPSQSHNGVAAVLAFALVLASTALILSARRR